MRPVSSWGRLSAFPHNVIELKDPQIAKQQICESSSLGVSYGMGRSYGDACLNLGNTLWATALLDHFISFDENSGYLVCEAGVLLQDIQKLVIPRGWMLPVTPGTEMVTIGGAVANDVHGKNHHICGSFGNHVEEIVIFRTNGDIISCGPSHNRNWFEATVGGVGLTGVILKVGIKLRKVDGPWLDTETVPYERLSDFCDLSKDSSNSHEYTVSWVDCISKKGENGVFIRANHAKSIVKNEPKVKTLSIPFVPPVSLVNRFSLLPFNLAYYHLNKLRSGNRVQYYRDFFYPLDNISQWNLIYGSKGFFQYQCVIPSAIATLAMTDILQEIKKVGEGSFLAVMKTFGNSESIGMLSFPMPGITLALDFPNRGCRTESLFKRLDAIVLEAKGRLYLAKDARMPKKLFESGYPRLNEFHQFRDPGVSSSLSRRLMGS